MPSYEFRKFSSVTMVSQKSVLKGQDHRSSDNYDLRKLKKASHLQWKCSDKNVVFDVKEDKKAARDPITFRSVCDGQITEFPSDSACNGLYMADPKGAQEAFSITVTPLEYRNAANWIEKTINENTPIRNINLPGTHDSAAINSWIHTPWACHYTSILEQLNGGIRLLDIRLKVKRDAQNAYYFQTCHGNLPGGEFEPFISVLDVCSSFVSSHSGEFIAMSLKIDDWNGNGDHQKDVFDSLKSVLSNYSSICDFRDYLLKEVKGKIMIINRLGSALFGPVWDWKDNDTFRPLGNLVIVQDKYEGLSTDSPKTDKFNQVENLINQKTDSNFTINFCSAIYFKLIGINVADRLMDYCGKHVQQKMPINWGWFLFDYAFNPIATDPYGALSIVDCIIDLNSPYHNYVAPYHVIPGKEEL